MWDSKEHLPDGNSVGSVLRLTVDGAVASSVGANRAVTVLESGVNNVWILQFQMASSTDTSNGTLVHLEYTETVKDASALAFKAKSGSNIMLYIVANIGDKQLFKQTDIGRSLSDLKKITKASTTLAGTSYPDEESIYLPMAGSSAIVTGFSYRFS